MDSNEDRIRQRAYELYLMRGGKDGGMDGSAAADWLMAEDEIRSLEDDAVDEASRESFPASDPPAH